MEWSKVKKSILENKDVQKEYDLMEAEYKIIEEIIMARREKIKSKNGVNMKKTIVLFIILFFICTTTLFSFDFSSYSPIEIEELMEYFKTISNNSSPGMKIFNHTAVRIRAILHELPVELDDNDIMNLRYNLQLLGIHPDSASLFGYKIEYKFPSGVEWQDEIKLVFFIQNIQIPYFERDFKLNDTIFWFAVYRQFNTFAQTGYFIVSVFLNEDYMIEYNVQ